MSRSSKKHVNEIIETLENELNSIKKLDRIDKMKMRTQIRKQANWLFTFRNPTPVKIFDKLEEKLPSVFFLYPYGFSDKLKDLLKKVLKIYKIDKCYKTTAVLPKFCPIPLTFYA
jgi:hypothetical protein